MSNPRIGDGHGFDKSWITFRAKKGDKEVTLKEEFRAELSVAVNMIVANGHLGSKVKVQPGAEYEITQEGIYRKEGEQRVNVIDDLGIKGKDRSELRKTVKSVASKASKVAASPGKIVIKVPSKIATDFAEDLEKQRKFSTHVSSIVKNWDKHAEILQSAGLVEDAISNINKEYMSLRDQAGLLTLKMQMARKQLAEDAIPLALETYSTALEKYDQYLKTFETIEKLVEPFREKLGPKSPLLIDFEQPTLNLSALTRLTAQAKEQQVTSQVAEKRLSLVQELQAKDIEDREKTLFQKAIGEVVKTEKTFCQQISQFANGYRQNETKIKDALRKKGYSDLEVAYLFSHFPDVAQVSEEMQKGLRGVQALSFVGKQEEAMDRYAQLMNEVYPAYCEVMKRGIFAQSEMGLINRGGVFFDDVEEILEKYNLVALTEGQKKLAFNDLGTLMIASTQRLPRHEFLYESAMKKAGNDPRWEPALKQIRENNKAVNTAIDRSGDFTDEDLTIATSAALTKNLSKKELPRFKAFYAEQAKVVGPIYNGWLAAKAESDPIKQRAYRAQLKKMVERSLPKLRKVDERLEKFGGMERLKELESTITDEKSLKEVKKFRQSILDRSHFIYDLMEDLHIQMKGEPGSVDRIIQDKALKAQLDVQGVKKGALSKFGRLYDSYLKAFEPLFLAKKALDDDPDNFQLQEALARTYKQQLPKLNSISRQMKMSEIEKFSSVIDAEKKSVEKSLSATGLLFPEQRVGLEKRQQMLGKIPSYASHLKEMESLIGDVVKDVHLGMSGDRNFIQKMLIKAKFIEDPAWKRTLSLNNVEDKDLKELNRFHDSLTELFGPIQEATRRVEASPGNMRARRDLKRLAERHAHKLQSWLDRFNLWGGLDMVQTCQKPTDEYREQLESRREQLLMAIDAPHSAEKQLVLRSEAFSRNELNEAIAQLERTQFYNTMLERLALIGDLGGRLERGEI
ncbi:MAG: hypothetical protein K1000chlam4_00713 [Chlamydiae bacterium]|nr:hypothetical protein [Chlamydiota bacterium]